MANDLAHETTNGEVWVRSLTLFLHPGVEMAAGKKVWKPGKHLEITYNEVSSQLMPVAWCYGKREEHGM